MQQKALDDLKTITYYYITLEVNYIDQLKVGEFAKYTYIYIF